MVCKCTSMNVLTTPYSLNIALTPPCSGLNRIGGGRGRRRRAAHRSTALRIELHQVLELCLSCSLSLSFPLPVRPFVRPSARPSRPSVRPSVRPSACLLHGPPASLAADRWVGGSVGGSVGLSLSGWGLACSKRRCSFFRFRFAHLELPRCRCRCRPSNSVCVHGRMRAHTNAYARMQS